MTTQNSSTTSTQVLSLQTVPAACPICLTNFSQPFAHYSIITPPPPLLPKINNYSRTAPTLWITTEILSLKSARRCLERTYIASHSIFDLKLLRSATYRYHKFIAAAKKSFNASLVQSSSSKPRALWKTINNILHRTANRSLPTSSPLAALSQLFAAYFSDKISKLHFNLQTKPSSTPVHSLPPPPHSLLHSFTPATLLEIDNLLSQSSDSYCDLDPVPTTVVKKISNAISPTILSIVNISITTGTFPSTLKSYIIDCYKKPSLNKEDLFNYRPIANLSFIFKLTEKIVKKRLFDHLTSNSLLNSIQSAYTNSTLPRLHYFPYMTIFLMPSPSNKSPAFVFLIYQLPFILSTTPSYSIVFPPGLAFPLLRYNGSLHTSHPAHLM